MVLRASSEGVLDPAQEVERLSAEIREQYLPFLVLAQRFEPADGVPYDHYIAQFEVMADPATPYPTPEARLSDIRHFIKDVEHLHALSPEQIRAIIDSRTDSPDEHRSIIQVRTMKEIPVPLAPERFASPDEIEHRLRLMQFDLAGLNSFIHETGFWNHIITSPQDIDPRNPNLPHLFNILNGGCNPLYTDRETGSVQQVFTIGKKLNFDVIFPHLKEWFRILRQYQYGTDGAVETPEHNSLSVADVITALAAEQLLHDVPRDMRASMRLRNGLISSDAVPNSERRSARRELEALQDVWTRTDWAQSLEESFDQMHSSLLVPSTAPFSYEADPSRPVDVIVMLYFNDIVATTKRVKELMQAHPHALILPSGGVAPQQLRTGRREKYSEADEMIAQLLAAGIPRVSILPADRVSTSTKTNVDNSIPRLEELQRYRGRPLDITVCTGVHHARRARFEFARGLPEGLVSSLRVAGADMPLAHGACQERNIQKLLATYTESMKILYEVLLGHNWDRAAQLDAA